ncbi:MAG TPA: RDD family protein [Steroidobacteraceae bacterium]|jgi:uncharacterized RDD family membrane protein YckC|nr:RDD family protein [Steroidobacteraceae bacterium]
MRISRFQRFLPLLALLLCASTLIVHAEPSKPRRPAAAAPAAPPSAATPPGTATPPSAADAPGTATPPSTAEAPEQPNWDSDADHDSHRHWRGRHGSHNHHDNDLVGIGHDTNLPQGEQADSVVAIFGSATSEGEAGDVVSVLGNTRVTGEVSDNVVAVLGSTTVDGKVGGNAVAVLGNVELGPHAEIGGDVVGVGGQVLRDPASIVHGNVQNVFTGNFGELNGLRTWIQHCLFYARPLALGEGLGWAWGIALTCLALYVLLALLFRDGLIQCVRTFETQPGRTILAALLTMLLTPVLVVLLCVTIIGIAAVPFVVISLFCAGLFGKAVMLAWIGRRIVGEGATGTPHQPAFTVLIGGLLVLVLYLIPVLGFVVYKLLGILGLGAVVYTLILAARARQATTPGGANASASSSPPSGAGSSGTGASSAAPFSTAAASATAGLDPAPGPIPPPTPEPAPAPPPGPPPGLASGPAPQAAPGPTPAPAAATAALPRAGFWVRMGALLLDALLVGFVVHVLLHEHHLHLLVLAVYGAVMWKLRGSTIGGIVFDLRVVRRDGRALDWETAIVRALGCFLSLAVAGLGFFWIAFDDDKQAWHDKIAGTVVVRVAKGAPLV